MKTRLSILVVGFVLSCQPARATIYMNWAFDCGGVSSSFAALVKDDSAGKGYFVYVDCDGSVNLWPVMCKANVPVGNLQAPDTMRELCHNARDISYPGVSVGVYLTDRESGAVIRFRNPADERERRAYEAMWKSERTPIKSTESDGH